MRLGLFGVWLVAALAAWLEVFAVAITVWGLWDHDWQMIFGGVLVAVIWPCVAGDVVRRASA